MVARIAAAVGLEVVDVEELPTMAGVWLWLAHQGAAEPTPAVSAVLVSEAARGQTLEYAGFRSELGAKHGLLRFLVEASVQEKGRCLRRPKGNTLLNYGDYGRLS